MAFVIRMKIIGLGLYH